MVDTNTLAKAGRYLSAALVVIFALNLVITAQIGPFVEVEPFLGSVEQFLVLLAASALISIDFMVASQQHEPDDSQDVENEPRTESHADTTVES